MEPFNRELQEIAVCGKFQSPNKHTLKEGSQDLSDLTFEEP